MKAYEEIDEILSLLEDELNALFQTGFSSIQSSSLEQLKRCITQSEQCGLSYLAKLLTQFYDGIKVMSHQVQKEYSTLVSLFSEIYEYLVICKRKIELERANDLLQSNKIQK